MAMMLEGVNLALYIKVICNDNSAKKYQSCICKQKLYIYIVENLTLYDARRYQSYTFLENVNSTLFMKAKGKEY